MSDTDWSEGWHYSAANGAQEGPISATNLVQLHLRKQVRPEDQVWHPGLPDWCSLREAWPRLRPYKQAISRSGGGGRTKVPRDYAVVDSGLSAEAIEKTLKAKAFEGWAYDSAIVIDAGRCLLVFKK